MSGDCVFLCGTYGMGPNWLGDKPKIIGTVRDIETKWMVVELDDELDLPPNDEKGWPRLWPERRSTTL